MHLKFPDCRDIGALPLTGLVVYSSVPGAVRPQRFLLLGIASALSVYSYLSYETL